MPGGLASDLAQRAAGSCTLRTLIQILPSQLQARCGTLRASDADCPHSHEMPSCPQAWTLHTLRLPK